MFSNLGVLKLDLELKTVAEISDEAYYLNFHFFFACFVLAVRHAVSGEAYFAFSLALGISV